MRRVFGSLRARLLLALAVIFALGALGMDALRRVHARSPDELLEANGMATEARQLVAALRLDRAGRLLRVDPPPEWRRVYGAPGSSTYAVWSAAGALEARSPNLEAPAATPPPLAAGAPALSPLRLVRGGAAVAVSARAPGGRVVVIERPNPGGRDKEAEPADLGDMAPTLLFAALALVAVTAGWGVAAWSLRPLSRAADELAQVGPDRPGARMSGRGLPSEFQPLAGYVNTALDRVAEAYAAQARFTADAAHALRTPLAVLDLRLQLAQSGAAAPDWPVVRADLDRLRRVVSDLLTLSRAERPSGERAGGAPTPVSLARLARETAAAMSPSAEAQGRSIEVEGSDAAPVRADPVELRDMLGALVDNALTHGAGRILLRVAASGGEAVVTVSDQGAGVPEGARETVFDRFAKLRGTSPGAGLGLSIVRRTARNAGGDARLVAAAAVEVRLPAAV